MLLCDFSTSKFNAKKSYFQCYISKSWTIIFQELEIDIGGHGQSKQSPFFIRVTWKIHLPSEFPLIYFPFDEILEADGLSK